jgi:Ca2+/Na+ antiporter
VKRIKKILRPFFVKYDTSGDKQLNIGEFGCLVRDLGENLDKSEVEEKFKKMDTNSSGDISYDEFCDCIMDYLSDASKFETVSSEAKKRTMPTFNMPDEEEEEMPEDLKDLDPATQQRRIICRSMAMMGFGTFLVLLFSDPMVDALGEWGNVLGVNPFYISFLVAPFASNASELLAAYSYAIKKTKASITTSLSTLVGAACMNNTFCLAIFFALVYFKRLAWTFFAETVAIILIQYIIGGLAIMSNQMSTKVAFLVLACYPGCLLIVAFLENVMGLD